MAPLDINSLRVKGADTVEGIEVCSIFLLIVVVRIRDLLLELDTSSCSDLQLYRAIRVGNYVSKKVVGKQAVSCYEQQYPADKHAGAARSHRQEWHAQFPLITVSTQLILKMVPSQFRGVGAHHRLRRCGKSYEDLGCDGFATRRLVGWHNCMIDFLTS